MMLVLDGEDSKELLIVADGGICNTTHASVSDCYHHPHRSKTYTATHSLRSGTGLAMTTTGSGTGQ